MTSLKVWSVVFIDFLSDTLPPTHIGSLSLSLSLSHRPSLPAVSSLAMLDSGSCLDGREERGAEQTGETTVGETVGGGV